MMKTGLIRAVLLAVGMLFPVMAAWGQYSGNIPPGAVLGNSQTTPRPAAPSTPAQMGLAAYAPTNAALKAHPAGTTGQYMARLGFSTAGDGGRADYTWQAANCAAADDGAQVQPSGTGCWVVDAPAAGIDFRVWGAVPGQNVDAPLKAAIAWACRTHTPILIPYPGATPYLIGSTVTIGNGSVTQNSTCNGVVLKGVPAYPEGTSGVGLFQAFKFTGAAGIIPFNVQGPAAAIKLLDIAVDCDNKCATAFRISNVMAGEFSGLGVYNNTGPGYIITSEPANVWIGGMEASWFHDLVANVPGTGGSGMLIGASTVANCATSAAVINDVFERIVIQYDGNAPSAYGIKLQYATQLSFSQITALRIGTALLGHSVVVQDPTGANCLNYPTDVKFSHTVMNDAVDTGTWVPVAGGIRFDHWNTVWGNFPIATTPGNFWGTDSKGQSYPGGVFALTDVSGAGLTFTVTEARYQRTGGVCTVAFNITYPVTSNGNGARIGTLPKPACLPIFTATASVGAPFVYTDLGLPASLLCDASAECVFYNNQSGTGYTNAALSGKNFRFLATYIVQPQ